MVEIQVGSKQQPLIMLPRIDGKAETVTRIKTVFSNFYVNDATTPIDWNLEYRTRTGAKTLINFDSVKSTDTQIFFFPDDAFFANVIKYTVLFFWTIGVEKVYSEIPITIDVKELHDES